jgi:heme/copper-type cytochrome/quinol oxidase subunit 3
LGLQAVITTKVLQNSFVMMWNYICGQLVTWGGNIEAYFYFSSQSQAVQKVSLRVPVAAELKWNALILLFQEYQKQGVLYSKETVIEKTSWGTREFPALDLHRNLLTFYEQI